VTKSGECRSAFADNLFENEMLDISNELIIVAEDILKLNYDHTMRGMVTDTGILMQNDNRSINKYYEFHASSKYE